MVETTGKQEDADSYVKQTVQYYQEASVRGIQAVKSKAGAAGVDRQTIEQFDSDDRGNLYKLWNWMSSTFHPRCAPSPFPRRVVRFLQKLAQDNADLFVHRRLGMTGTFA